MANGGKEIPWGQIAAIVASFMANRGGGEAENNLIFPPTILPPDYPFQQSLWQDYMPGLMGQQIPSFEQAGGIFGGPSSPMQQAANLMMQQQSTSQPMFMGGVAGSLGNLAGQSYDPGSADFALERFLAPNFINPDLTDPWAQAQTPSPFSIGGGTANRTPFPSPGQGWGEINLGMSPGILGGPMGGGGGGGGKPPPGGGGGGKPTTGSPGGGGKEGKDGGPGGGGPIMKSQAFPQQSLFTPTGMGAHKGAASSGPLPLGAASGSSPMLALRSSGNNNDEDDGKDGTPDMPQVPMPDVTVTGDDPGPAPGELGSGIPNPIFPPGGFQPIGGWPTPGGGGGGGNVYGSSSADPIDLTTAPPHPGDDASEDEKKKWWQKMLKWLKENFTLGGGMLPRKPKGPSFEGGDVPGGGGGEGEEPPLGTPGGGLEDKQDCPPGSINIGGQCIPLGSLGAGGDGVDTTGKDDKSTIQGQDQVGEGGWWVYPGLERPALPNPADLFQFQPSTFDFSNYTQWQNPSMQLPVAQPGGVDPSSGWF